MRVACIRFSQKTDLEKVALLALRFSPQICIKPQEAVFVEIGKCKNLYSESNFLFRMHILLKQQGLQPEIRIGQNICDAFIFAKYRTQSVGACKTTALKDLFDPFEKDPVGRKYIQKLIESLDNVGITKIEEFRKLPIRDLVSRFGAPALLCRQRLEDEVSLPWPAWHPADILMETQEYPYSDFKANLQTLCAEVDILLRRLFPKLLSNGKKLLKLKMTIWCEKHSFHKNSVRYFDFHFLLPQSDPALTLRIMEEKLSKELRLNPLRSSLEKIEVQIVETTLGTSGQRHFFHNREEEENNLSGMLAQLTERYGEENIFQAQLFEERVPEKSWRRVPLTQASSLDLNEKIPLRPTHLISPQKIQKVGDQLYISKKSYRILYWSEIVETIFSGWLTQEIYRQYYKVKVEGQNLLWIYRAQNQDYFLHGYFG